MKLKRYEKYKQSGIEWIGEIPKHWETKRLKYVASIQPSNVDKKTIEGELPVLLCNYMDVYKNEFIDSSISFMQATATEAEIAKFTIKKGDVLVTKDSETPDDIANPAFVKDDFNNVICAYHLTQIRPNRDKLIGKYLFRLFQEHRYKGQFEVAANGVTRFGLSVSAFSDAFVPLPHPDEQTAIATYLDKKTAQIDTLIEKKQNLIELLKEERTAIINHAVTKGINPKAKLKPSGIEWLGYIPDHWKVKRLKYVAKIQSSNVDKKTNEGEKTILLCNYIDVYKNEFIDESISFMEATATEKEIEKFILSKGDVLITKDSETPDDIANPTYVVKDFDNVICGYHLAQIRANQTKLHGEYLFRLFQSKQFNTHFEVSANGVTRFGLPLDSITDVFVPLPSSKEQTRITEHVLKGTSKIDTTISKIEKEIGLLQEYRTALISEVVTGKIKVI